MEAWLEANPATATLIVSLIMALLTSLVGWIKTTKWGKDNAAASALFASLLEHASKRGGTALDVKKAVSALDGTTKITPADPVPMPSLLSPGITDAIADAVNTADPRKETPTAGAIALREALRGVVDIKASGPSVATTTSLLILCSLVFLGCATPRPVLDATLMSMQATETIQRNTFTLVDAMHQELVDVTAKGNAAVLDSKKKDLMRPDGSVDLAQYDALLGQAANAQQAAEAQFARELGPLKLDLAIQFETQKHLAGLVSAYNNAKGITPETFQALLDATSELATQAINAQRAANASKPLDPNAVDWQGVFGLVQKRVADSLITRLNTPASGSVTP